MCRGKRRSAVVFAVASGSLLEHLEHLSVMLLLVGRAELQLLSPMVMRSCLLVSLERQKERGIHCIITISHQVLRC